MQAAPRITIGLGRIAAWAVAATMAASGIVFTEPAPVDLAMLGLVVLLPLTGLQRVTPALVGYLMAWLACGAGALLASSASADVARSATHAGISFYLYVASFVLAAFVAHSPRQHAELILKATVPAAMLAAAAGLVGYFGLMPGAHDLFTKFGRAAGTFKDPNVLGPFLVPSILYCCHRALTGGRNEARLGLGLAAFLSLALLLSFSRGAWINLAVAMSLYGYLTLITTASATDRRRLLTLGGIAVGLVAATVVAALQIDSVASLMAERSSLAQGYDIGPQGRFGGQEKALALLLENPLGLGAGQFAARFHHEDVHNVYLSMFLNAGWLGGLMFAAILALTLVMGLAHVARARACRPMFIIAFAALAANIAEGVVIDIDHWRHVYVLLAIVWGVMSVPADRRAGETQ